MRIIAQLNPPHPHSLHHHQTHTNKYIYISDTHVSLVHAHSLHPHTKKTCFAPTGLVWNPNGGEATAAAPSAAPAASSGAPPPPPPSGPAPVFDVSDVAEKPATDSRAGLFAALNKGDSVTSGLKKVDKSLMTHKNPELRASSVVPAAAAAPKPAAAKAAPKYGGAAKVR